LRIGHMKFGTAERLNQVVVACARHKDARSRIRASAAVNVVAAGGMPNGIPITNCYALSPKRGSETPNPSDFLGLTSANRANCVVEAYV
jgi:hypothetical protein